MLSDETTRYFIVIEAIFVILTLGHALYTYIGEVAEQAARDDLGRSCCDEQQMGYFVARRPRRLAYFFKRATIRVPEVPAVENIIQAGDRGLFTSALFDHIDSTPRDVSWVSLYTQFFKGMAWLDGGQTERARGHEYIGKHMKKGDDHRKDLLTKGHELPIPVKSWNRAATEGDVEAVIASESSSENQYILMKPECRESTPVRHCLFPGKPKGSTFLVSCALALKKANTPKGQLDKTLDFPDVRPLWLIEGKPCIEMAREELAGLALTLGIPLRRHSDGSFSGTGPFGSHLSLARHICHWRLRLTHQHRQFDHEAQHGSGYSTLSAKHMACDCLPLDFDKRPKGDHVVKCVDTVRTLHVGGDFLEWIRGQEFAQAVNDANDLPPESRRPDYDLSPLEEDTDTCQELKYLYRLPSAYKTDAYIYPKCPKPPKYEEYEEEVKKEKPNENGRYTQHWFNAVARIAFGGLVPQAGPFLINAVLLTVTSEYRGDCENCQAYIWKEKSDRGRDIERDTNYGSFDRRQPRRMHSFATASRVGLSPSSSRSTSHRRRLPTASMPTSTITPSNPLQVSSRQADPSNISSSFTPMALQQLINALDTDCPQFKLFGDFVRRRARGAVKWLDTDCCIPSTPRHAGALFSRYTTALERLVAISLLQHPEHITASTPTPRNATPVSAKGNVRHGESTERRGFVPIVRSVAEAAAGVPARFLDWRKTTTQPTEADAESYVKEVWRKCAQQLSENFKNSLNTSNLVVAVHNVRDKLLGCKTVKNQEVRLEGEDRIITVEDCANVARCIIACWALRVPFIELEWAYSDLIPDSVALTELPSVIAFG